MLAAQVAKTSAPGEAADVDRCEALRTALLQRTEPIGDVFEASTKRQDVTTIGAETANASCPPEKALRLYRLVRALRPSKVVEFGSALGVSGAYLASALRANGSGHLVTVEGSPSRQAVAAASIESVAPGVTTSLCGYFDDHLDVLAGSDLFFNDGNHQRDAALRYATAACERMSRPALMVLDDAIGYSAQMDEAWRQLRRDSRFSAAESLGPLALLEVGGEPRSRITRLLRLGRLPRR